MNRQAWAVPATPEDASEAATYLISATEMGLMPKQRASDGEKQTFIRMLASYDYTRAELIEAMKEVPRHPERFGGRGVTIQDVERIIRESRQMRARLRQPMSEEAMHELLEAYPQDLEREDFKCCGFGRGIDSGEPRYRYAPDVEEHAGPPRPALEEKNTSRSGDGSADGNPLGDFITVPEEDEEDN